MRFAARLRAAAVAAAAVLLLSACAAGAGEAGAAASGPTRTVVDVEGTEVVVPEQPQRVVALSEPTLDGVLALGVEPIGTVSGRGQQTVPNYLLDRAGDLPILGGIAQRIFAPTQLPVGVVTGSLGGIYLIWLLSSEWRKQKA